MKLAIKNLNEEERLTIRGAVELAMAYWPNDGGDDTPRQTMRRAFRWLRKMMVDERLAWHYACARLENDAYAHADM